MGTPKRERQKANRALKQQQVEQSQSRRKLLRKVAIGVAVVAGILLFVWIASTIVGSDDESTTPATVPIEPTTESTAPATTDATGG